MAPNIKPSQLTVPPPDPLNDRAMEHWVRTTFAVGTPVLISPHSHRRLSTRGTAKGVVTAIDAPTRSRPGYVYYHLTDLRDSQGHVADDDMDVLNALHDGRGLGSPWHDLAGRFPEIEVIVDNWAQHRSKPLGRHALPRSQRSPLKPNIAWDRLSVPPPSWKNEHAWERWAQKTFAVGTPVKVSSRYPPWQLPPGARAVVVGWEKVQSSRIRVPRIEITDARDQWGIQTPHVGHVYIIDFDDIEPMVDNWVTTPYMGRKLKGTTPNPYRERSEPTHECRRWQRSWMMPHNEAWRCVSCDSPADFWQSIKLDWRRPNAVVGDIIETP